MADSQMASHRASSRSTKSRGSYASAGTAPCSTSSIGPWRASAACAKTRLVCSPLSKSVPIATARASTASRSATSGARACASPSRAMAAPASANASARPRAGPFSAPVITATLPASAAVIERPASRRGAADGQLLDPVDEVRPEATHRSRRSKPRHPSEQLLEHDARFESRQARTETEVRSAGTEGNVVVRVALDVELVRSFERSIVAIGRRVPHRDLVARADLLATELRVGSRRAPEVHHRGDPPQHLLDGGWQERHVGLQLGPLLRVLEEGERAAGDEVARGLAPRVHQQHEEQIDIEGAQPRPLDLRGQQDAQEIAAVAVLALVRQAVGVREHL